MTKPMSLPTHPQPNTRVHPEVHSTSHTEANGAPAAVVPPVAAPPVVVLGSGLEAGGWNNRRILWLLAVGTLIVSLVWHAPNEVRYIFERAGELFLTLVLAMAGTYLMRPAVRGLMRLPFFGTYRNGKTWATIAVFVGGLALLWVFFLFGLKPIVADMRELWSNFMPSDPADRAEKMKVWKDSLRTALTPYASLLPFKLDEMDAALAGYTQQGTRLLAAKLSHSFSPGFIVELILIPVLVFYFLTDGRAIRAEARLLAPDQWHARGSQMLTDFDRVLDGYIRGQVIMCLIAWVFVTLLLMALHVPHAFILGLVAGITRAVPVIGPLLGGIPLILITLLTTGDMHTAGTLLIAFTLMHFLESKVLLPKIVGHEVDLHPVSVIIALLVGMEFFGFMGVFLAVPLAALMKILLTEMHEKRAQIAQNQGDAATMRDVHEASALTY